MAGFRNHWFFRDEKASLTIYSLFIFVLILMMAGMAVDMMRHEKQRVAIQNALDTGVLAAANLSSSANTDAEIEAMVLDYVAKAGINPDGVTVYPQGVDPTSRTVAATSNFEMGTIFMGLLGIDELAGNVASQAQQSADFLEISLILDVSFSMSFDGRIESLRPAAKQFVTEILSKVDPDKIAISIVPYNHQVHLDDETRALINWDNKTVSIPASQRSYTNSLASYETFNPESRCARFHDDDYLTTSLVSTPDVEATATFSDSRAFGFTNTEFEQYLDATVYCSDRYAPLFLYRNSETELHTFIDTLQGGGMTAIDHAMNWGTAILDDDFAPVVQGLSISGTLPTEMAGHPFAFNSNNPANKIIVLMSDGENTDHMDLASAFKSGPTRIWYSETQAGGVEFNGYLVEMPDNPASQRWFVPGSPLSGMDDTYLDEAALPADAVQWDYHKLYRRFRVEDVPSYFFGPDPVAQAAHAGARIDTGSFGVADQRTRNICNTARAEGIVIYTIAFQAPEISQSLLRDCAGQIGRYYDVADNNIASAFDSIAQNVTELRLTR